MRLDADTFQSHNARCRRLAKAAFWPGHPVGQPLCKCTGSSDVCVKRRHRDQNAAVHIRRRQGVFCECPKGRHGCRVCQVRGQTSKPGVRAGLLGGWVGCVGNATERSACMLTSYQLPQQAAECGLPCAGERRSCFTGQPGSEDDSRRRGTGRRWVQRWWRGRGRRWRGLGRWR